MTSGSVDVMSYSVDEVDVPVYDIEAAKVCYISKMDFYNLVILNDYLLVDTRSAQSFSQFAIANAINIPPDYGQLLDNIKYPNVELNHTVLLYHGDSVSEYEHMVNVANYFAHRPQVQNVYILQELFEEFYNNYSFMCKGDASNGSIYPCQLLSHLFLGSALSASNTQVINELGITHLLQADSSLTERSPPIPQTSDIKVIQIGYDESNEQSMRHLYEYSSQVIEEAKSRHGKVLLFCHRGESKAPCVALVYLMKTLGWTYEEAESYIKRARPVVELNSALDEVAKQLELEIFDVDM